MLILLIVLLLVLGGGGGYYGHSRWGYGGGAGIGLGTKFLPLINAAVVGPFHSKHARARGGGQAVLFRTILFRARIVTRPRCDILALENKAGVYPTLFGRPNVWFSVLAPRPRESRRRDGGRFLT